MRQLYCTFLFLLPILVTAETLSIVSDSNCVQSGGRLRACIASSQTVTLDKLLPEYIPLQTKIAVSVEGNCSTSYPLYIEILGDDSQSVGSIDVFTDRNVDLNNSNYSEFGTVTFLTDSPYSAIASYDPSCQILADMEFNKVDIDGLTENLRDLKSEKEKELSLISDLVEKQELIIDLSGAVTVYESVINTADLDRISLLELNTILAESCTDGNQCTWSNKILAILQNSPDLQPSQQFLLFSLAQKLDTLVPSDCEDENCVASIIDAETRNTLDEIIEKTPSLSEAEEDLKEYLAHKQSLELVLDDYKQTCGEYGIEWGAL
jgi:hypothetical protein